MWKVAAVWNLSVGQRAGCDRAGKQKETDKKKVMVPTDYCTVLHYTVLVVTHVAKLKMFLFYIIIIIDFIQP